MYDNEQYEEARERVVRRYFWRVGFFVNAIFFTLVMLLLLGRAIETQDSSIIIGMLMTGLLWGSVIVGHFGIAFNVFNRFIDRQTERELQRGYKAKRSRLELGEDGELVEVADDWQAEDTVTEYEQRSSRE